MPITDITDNFEGLNAHDRVYSSDSGYTVKVKVVQRPTGSPERLSFSITGSLCNDADATALPFGDGYFISSPHEISAHSESPIDLADEIEAGRQEVVRRVELAAINQAAASALDGVLPAGDD